MGCGTGDLIYFLAKEKKAKTVTEETGQVLGASDDKIDEGFLKLLTAENTENKKKSDFENEIRIRASTQFQISFNSNVCVQYYWRPGPSHIRYNNFWSDYMLSYQDLLFDSNKQIYLLSDWQCGYKRILRTLRGGFRKTP